MVTTTTTVTTTIIIMAEPGSLARLLQLCSPMLPIGAYGYSQGLESAIEDGIVTTGAEAGDWIRDVFRFGLCRFDLPMVLRLRAAWDRDRAEALGLNRRYLAGRDTAEFRAEAAQTGHSLHRLLRDLGELPAGIDTLDSESAVCQPLAFAIAASCWRIAPSDMARGFAWAWAENQVAVALKAIPIGQVAGQRILLVFGDLLDAALPGVLALPDDDIANLLPGLSILSCRHETQYSRLFRS